MKHNGSGTGNLKLFRSILCFATVITACGIWAGCGSSSSDSSDNMHITGQLLMTAAPAKALAAVPVVNAHVAALGTGGFAVTDATGNFTLFSSVTGPAITLEVQAAEFSGIYVIENIPEGTVQINMVLNYLGVTKQIVADSLVFKDENGNPVEPAPVVTPTPTPGATVEPTPTPGGTATPTPAPTAAPTPASKFDANGNTTAFGIPAGLTGNINAGAPVWSGKCSACHGSQKTNLSYQQLQDSLNISAMRGVNISNQQLADLTAYLNRSQK